MYCSKCGKTIADDSKFCKYCGEIQEETAQPITVNNNKSSSDKKTTTQKKEDSSRVQRVITVLFVLLIAWLVGRFVITPMFLSDVAENKPKEQGPVFVGLDSANNVTDKYLNYNDLFFDEEQGTAVVHNKIIFMMDVSSYAIRYEDRTINAIDLCCKDDKVVRVDNTTYIPIKGETQQYIELLDTHYRDKGSIYSEFDFCTVSYDISENYYTMTVEIKELDKPENLKALEDAGIIYVENEISFDAADKQLLENDYLKQ